jgi:hypothetical protein
MRYAMNMGEKTIKNLAPMRLVIPMKMRPVIPKTMMATLDY